MAAPSHGSLLRRYVSDRRYKLAMPRAAALQLLHPAIAAGAAQHSQFPDDVWIQLDRALPLTLATARGSSRTGRRVRDLHGHVTGKDDLGRRYHALAPEIFHWEHATFVDALFTMIDVFDRPLGPAERERLYQECCDWYRSYGVSDRPLPPDWHAFTEYMDHMCETELRLTPSAEALTGRLLEPCPWKFRRMPEYAVRGILPPRVRTLLDLPWTGDDARRFRTYAIAVRTRHRLRLGL
ncbi:oxygenase MpaB family protein [Actinocorallia sp. B10E7]|uniref:oxygenase MpaB family protein n=1 Tax=Actinocorallia sp. B10E7 TaxID=3153558 RepID=UPI00325D7E8E